MLTLTTAVLAGAHREAVLWLCRSLLTSPVGVGSSPAATAGAVSSAATPLVQLAQHALSQTLFGLGLGARISFPILVGVTSGHLLLGLTGRFAPQINLQSIGFTVALLAGGAALYLFAPTTIELVARHTILALSSQ
jgi:flagellar biosynthesis protein FliR